MHSDNDKRKIAEAFTALCELHDKKISLFARKMYVESLKGFSADQITLAISQSIREHKWFPKPAELIELITGPTPQIEDIAETQANFVISQVRKLGSWRTPVFVDPITRDLMNSRFNFTSLCQQTESDMQWFAKQFKIAYRTCIAMDEGNKRIEMTGKLKKLVSGIGG